VESIVTTETRLDNREVLASVFLVGWVDSLHAQIEP
jgi:hypothetical protein